MCLASYLALLPIKMLASKVLTNTYQQATRLLATGVALLLLAGCGFHIRGDFQVPPNLTEVAINAPKRSDVAAALHNALELRGIAVVNYAIDIPIIEIGEDKLDRRTLSLLPSGQVAEYEFIYTLPVTFTDSSGRVSQQVIQLTRDYQDDPNFALAKTREFELVISEMRNDAVRRTLILMNQYLRN